MTTENMISLIAIILGSNWLGQFLMKIYETKSKKKTPIDVIIRSLARRDLLKTAEDYLDQGYIPSDEYDDFVKEYQAYKDLDGNGKVEKLVTQAMNLPLKNGGTD